MRILKYLFLLLLLFMIGLTVFVTTQKGDYDITQSKVIKTPRNTVYAFINDYRNWETFGSWLKDEKALKTRYSSESTGKGAYFSWKGIESTGNIKTLSVTENESISQKMDYDGSRSEVMWTFKDTLGATKVSWRSKGKMTAMMKIKAFFKGGMSSIMQELFEKSLANLDRTLDYEINTFSIKVNGTTTLPKRFYIGQTINSYDDKAIKNIKILLPKMMAFFEKNKIVMGGRPFVAYHNTNGQVVNFSVRVPMRDSVYIMPGSEVESGETAVMYAVKATLTGDYSHLKAARKKAIDYIAQNNLKQNAQNPVTEVYIKTIKDSKQPSKWVTEVYVPVYPKAAARPATYKPKDSTAVSVPVPEDIPADQ